MTTNTVDYHGYEITNARVNEREVFVVNLTDNKLYTFAELSFTSLKEAQEFINARQAEQIVDL